MNGRAAAGDWVEIGRVLLAAGERAAGVPKETQAVPLEMRARGFLQAAATLGEPVVILTLAGRRLEGRLVAVNPAYTHGFGPPVPELLAIAAEVRE